MRALFWLSLMSASVCLAGDRVTDEAMRMRVMHLAFPRAQIATVRSQPVEKQVVQRQTFPQRDTLLAGPQYEVTGSVTERERLSAEDLTSDAISDKRRVQMQLYRWKVAGNEPLLVAVMSYQFLGVHPARCCWALGKVLLLPASLEGVLDTVHIQPHAFTMFTSIRFIQIKGAAENLMVEVNTGFAGGAGSYGVVMAAVANRIEPLLSIMTMVDGGLDMNVYALTLDESRTFNGGGKIFYFTQKSYWIEGKPLMKEVTTKVSYPVGTGLPLDW